MTWQVINEKMPWSLVLLLGGGFALARAAQDSGFSQMLGEELKVLDVLDRRVLVFVICLFSALATEVTSSTATTTIILPILKDLVRQSKS